MYLFSFLSLNANHKESVFVALLTGYYIISIILHARHPDVRTNLHFPLAHLSVFFLGCSQAVMTIIIYAAGILMSVQCFHSPLHICIV